MRQDENNMPATSIKSLEGLKVEMRAWMESHPHEYADFAAAMNGGGKVGLRMLGLMAKGKIKSLENDVAMQSGLAEPDFSSLLDAVTASDMPSRFFKEESDRRNAVLAWLLYGRTYESIVEHLETMIADARFSGYRWLLTQLSRFIISRSIRNGNRTHADWEEYRRYRKAVISGCVADIIEDTAGPTMATVDKVLKRRSLIEILDDKSELFDKVGEWLVSRHSGIDEAYLIIALKESGYDIDNVQEFHEAVTNQFSDVRLRAVQKQMKVLETVVGMGKHAPKDKGKDREIIDSIKQFLSD